MRPVSCHWLGCGGGGVTEEGRVIPSPVIVTRGQGLGGGRGLIRHVSLYSFLTFLLDEDLCFSSSLGGKRISLINLNLDRNS